MFIYKITVDNKVYIGFDSKDKSINHRWNIHKRVAEIGCTKTKLYRAMKQHCIENCKYEIIDEDFSSIAELAAAEIEYIAQYDSYRNGLNSTPGGDGLGTHNLYMLSDEEILAVKESLSQSMRDYNNNIKWANTTKDQRREMTRAWWDRPSELRSKQVKKYWDTVDEEKKNHQLRGLRNRWVGIPYEERSRINKANGLKGAMKIAKKIKVEFEDGRIEIFPSKSEYHRQYGATSINYTIMKTKKGLYHNGRKIWEL